MTRKVKKVTTSERPALCDIFSFGFGNGQRHPDYSRYDMHIFWLVTVTGEQKRKYQKKKGPDATDPIHKINEHFCVYYNTEKGKSNG